MKKKLEVIKCKKEEIELKETRTILNDMPRTFKHPKEKLTHLYKNEAKTLCGKEVLFQFLEYDLLTNDDHKICPKCKHIFWEKFYGFSFRNEEIFQKENVQYKKVFIFCDTPPYVKRIHFSKLKAGDVIYFENPDGELEVEVADDGEFLYVLKESPTVHSINADFKPTDWVVKVDTLRNFEDTFKTAFNVISFDLIQGL